MKNNKFTIAAVVVVLVGIYMVGSQFFAAEDVEMKKDLHEYAAMVIEKCAEAPYKSGCYSTEIPKLMDYISMEEAFEVTKVIQTQGDAEYTCHVLGHNISAKETAKDPSKWKDIVTRCPLGVCDNGCIHGAFQERFRTETMTDFEIDTIVPELKTLCESRDTWSPTYMERVTCYHAIGHLLMYITGGDIHKSIQICEHLYPAHSKFCFDGSFMQIFLPLEPEDLDLVKKIAPQTQEEAETFCASFDGLENTSCYQESWPLYREELLTPEGFVKFCSYTEDLYIKSQCFNSSIYLTILDLELDVQKITEFCTAFPDTQKGLCFSFAASRMLQSDHNLREKAVSLCNTADLYGEGEQCYDRIIYMSNINYHPGSIEGQHLCDMLPEPWNTQCAQQ